MAFSELSFIENETGLTFNEEFNILGGEMNGVPVAVFDNYTRHRFDIVFGAEVGDKVLPDIMSLTSPFPKKTVLGIEKEDGCVKVFCKDYQLSQERLPLLITFLKRATELIAKKKPRLKDLDYDKIHALSVYMVLTRRDNSIKTSKKKKDKKLTKQSVLILVRGILGGLLGLIIGCSIFTVFIMLNNIVGWFGGLIMSAAVISLYTVFSRRLKTPDVIICGIMCIIGWLFSNTFAYLFKIFLSEQENGLNIFGIINNFGYYASKYSELTLGYSNLLTVTFIFVFAGTVGSCIFYFRYHKSDMY